MTDREMDDERESSELKLLADLDVYFVCMKEEKSFDRAPCVV